MTEGGTSSTSGGGGARGQPQVLTEPARTLMIKPIKEGNVAGSCLAVVLARAAATAAPRTVVLTRGQGRR
jgi:hypothetical protein